MLLLLLLCLLLLLDSSLCDSVEIDFRVGVVRGYNSRISFVDPPAFVGARGRGCVGQSVIRVDLLPPFTQLQLALEYDRPRGWTLDVAESELAEGQGVNDEGGHGKGASELSINNRQLRLHSNSLPGFRGATIDGGYLLKVVDGVVKQGSRLLIELGRGRVWWSMSGRGDQVLSPFVFGVSPFVYVSFNRVVGGSWRRGRGLCRATLTLIPDSDQCSLGSHHCDVNAVCKNTRRSFRCRCKPGYEGDGKQCQDRNECSLRNGGCVHLCNNQPGNYSCSCFDGFRLDDDKHNCVDIDECANKSCSHECANTIGSYHCRCPDGMYLSFDGKTCSAGGSLCRNRGCEFGCRLHGSSPICFCPTGFVLSPNGRSCVASCLQNNGGCQHKCTRTVSGVICSCHYKYILGVDNKSCTPSCSINNGGCDRKCSMTPQGLVKCSCPNGFLLHSDGKSCIDVDECSVGGGGCSHSCRNSLGSFECVCPIGYKLLPDEKTCSEFNECTISGTCDHFCVNTPGSYYCTCKEGYEKYGVTHCGDIDECALDNGGCSQLCVNTPGSFKCKCNPGFYVHQNNKDCLEIDRFGIENEAAVGISCDENACGITCQNQSQLIHKKNDSYVFVCGMTEAEKCKLGEGNGKSCQQKQHRKKVTIYAATNECRLIQKSIPPTSLPQLLPFGNVKFIRVSCEPKWKPKWRLNSQPHPRTSIIQIQIEIGLHSISRGLLYHLRHYINDGLFYFTHLSRHFFLSISPTSGFCPEEREIYLAGSCVSCSPGSFFDLRGSRCVSCPVGTFQNKHTQLECDHCPHNPLIPVVGSTNLSQCGAECLPGFFSVDGFQPCSLCPGGHYQSEPGRSFCHSCGRGVAASLPGAVSFNQCNITVSCLRGSYFNSAAGSCDLCPRGSYQPENNRNFCFKCPGNTTTDTDGSTELSQCKSHTCGGWVGKLLGIFESPNYPGNYPDNVHCTWMIRAQKGRRILVVVPEVFLANDQCGDSLVMRKSRSPYSVTSYDTCQSQERPIAFTSRSRKLWIQFKSDSQNNAQGFRIPYALFNKEYEPLIKSIVRDSQLYAMISHQEILKDRKLMTALMDVIAHPINYYKYANISWAWFPDSFVRFIMAKVKDFFS